MSPDRGPPTYKSLIPRKSDDYPVEQLTPQPLLYDLSDGVREEAIEAVE